METEENKEKFRVITDVLPDPKRLPNGWLMLQRRENGAIYKHRNGLGVIASAAQISDGKAWLKVTVSRPNRLPNHEDLCLVKREFIGIGRLALQLFMPEDELVKITPTCLNLWYCLDGDPLPAFCEEKA